jgi:hypothetical protein
MRYGLTEITDSSPAPEMPITLAEAKTHLRVDFSADDSLISDLISAATRFAENYTRRTFASREFRLTLPAFPRRYAVSYYAPQDGDVWPTRFGNPSQSYTWPEAILLPVGPVETVSQIIYMAEDTAGAPVATVLPPALYEEALSSDPAFIVPAYGETWPDTIRAPEAVVVDFFAGGVPVPDDVKAAIKIMIAHFYEYREPIVIGTIVATVPYSVRALLAPHRRFPL